MRLYGMDNLIIDIYNIRNIEVVNIYDIMVPGTNKMDVIPSMLVIYDGGKTINLCSRDKYFNLLVRKVIEVYKDEKNNVLEDSLTDPFRLRNGIKISDRTKSILESGTLTATNDLYKFYDGKKNYECSLLFTNDKVKLLIPIIKYHINQLFFVTDKNVHFLDYLNGYKNNYMLSGYVNGIFKYFPLRFDEIDDNEYVVEIGGLLENNSTIFINIKFLKDRISVDININKYNIIGTFIYLVSTEVIKEIASIKRDNVLVYYRNSDLSLCNNLYNSITDFDQNIELKWFKLPWDAIYGINTKIEKLSENERIIQIYNMYVDSSDEYSFMRREYFSKNYIRSGIVSNFGENISLDEVVKNTIGVCLNKDDCTYLIETSFLDTMHSNGYYVEKFSGNYFYHLMQSSSIRDIDRGKLVTISHEDGVLEDSDFLNDDLVLKLVRGK